MQMRIQHRSPATHDKGAEVKVAQRLVSWFGLNGPGAEPTPGGRIPFWHGVPKSSYLLISALWTLVAILTTWVVNRELGQSYDWYTVPLICGVALYALGMAVTERLLLRVPQAPAGR